MVRIMQYCCLKNLFCRMLNLATRNLSSTTDKQEIDHFSNLQNIWWDNDGILKPLHAMNKLRIPFIRDGLINAGSAHKELLNTALPLKHLHLLDVGCGGGILTEPLSKLGCFVTGIDASEDLVEVAKAHKNLDPQLTNLSYSLCTIEDHAATNKGKYDAVIASEVVEHVDNMDFFLKSCVTCLKPNGSVFITTINQTAISWVVGIVLAEYVLKILPKGTHHWNKFAPPHVVQKILEDNRCRTRAIHGFSYNIFTNNWFWVSNTSVHYGLHAIKK